MTFTKWWEVEKKYNIKTIGLKKKKAEKVKKKSFFDGLIRVSTNGS